MLRYVLGLRQVIKRFVKRVPAAYIISNLLVVVAVDKLADTSLTNFFFAYFTLSDKNSINPLKLVSEVNLATGPDRR